MARWKRHSRSEYNKVLRKIAATEYLVDKYFEVDDKLHIKYANRLKILYNTADIIAQHLGLFLYEGCALKNWADNFSFCKECSGYFKRWRQGEKFVMTSSDDELHRWCPWKRINT